MHSPQCAPFTWAALVIPAPQQGEQTLVPANALNFDIGWFDTANAIAFSGIRARFRLQELGGKPVFLYSNPASSLSVFIPWTKVHVFVDELSGLDGYAWLLTLEKLEPSTDR